MITTDIHARDVVSRLIESNVKGAHEFQWQAQLRTFWRPETRDVDVHITDHRFEYYFEWQGTQPMLVITPLTDRCYSTLAIALRMYRGGAPVGPAGTGKTETTKDMAKKIGLNCIVVNCSDMMDWLDLLNIVSGLAGTGFWGCFDEFNRIAIEVMSVVAAQLLALQQALVQHAATGVGAFSFEQNGRSNVLGENSLGDGSIPIVPSVGVFVTMNPGYAGRSELPAQLKAWFRAIALTVPDTLLIVEVMLVCEGFEDATVVSAKLMSVVVQCKELMSKQRHYDWGLRFILSLIRSAGAAKRQNPASDGSTVVLHTMRGHVRSKLTRADAAIFERVLAAVFMGVADTAGGGAADADWHDKVCRVAEERGLQATDRFVLKAVQVRETLDVRHSMIMVGPGGSGKTEIFNACLMTDNLLDGWRDQPAGRCFKSKAAAVAERLSPRAVTPAELYGWFSAADRRWTDGCLAIIFRGMSECAAAQGFYDYQTRQCVVCDGAMDPIWVEDLNTVMDDNKVLTLANGARYKMTVPMRMVFETHSLAVSSPATVSRNGIVYINGADIGWRPYVVSRAARKENEAIAAHMLSLFDEEHIGAAVAGVDAERNAMGEPSIRLIARIAAACGLFEAALRPAGAGISESAAMSAFIFAVTWAFGGTLVVDDATGLDARQAFHDELMGAMQKGTLPQVALPEQVGGRTASVFDFWYDGSSGRWVPWSEAGVPDYVHAPIGVRPGEVHFSDIMVQTPHSVCLSRLMELLVEASHNVMVVGPAGTGKTAIIKAFLRDLAEQSKVFLFTSINANYFMDAKALQQQFDQAIEKRAGRHFGPPATKKMIYFIDDINLPCMTEYGVQPPVELVRQLIDHKSYFDRDDLGSRKMIDDVQHVAAMNPGRHCIDERCQRRYAALGCWMPLCLHAIFSPILLGHLEGISDTAAALAPSITEATLKLHSAVAAALRATAAKFCYEWSMRELSRVFQGLCLANAATHATSMQLVRLWSYECHRVFADRLINTEDVETFEARFAEVAHSVFKGTPGVDAANIHVDDTQAQAQSPLYKHGSMPEDVSHALSEWLQEYNEAFARMDLVLFDYAVVHTTRIVRIISRPRGHAVLVGEQGSGKQSLSRLASFVCGNQVHEFQPDPRVAGARAALKDAIKLVGVRGAKVTFLFTGDGIADEQIHSLLTELMSTGWIAGLFDDDELAEVVGRSGAQQARWQHKRRSSAALYRLAEAESAGAVPDTPEGMLAFVRARVCSHLHVVGVFTPRRLEGARVINPGLLSCAALDWFHTWPHEALAAVGKHFLADLDLGMFDILGDAATETKQTLGAHAAEVFLSTALECDRYTAVHERHRHMTPGSLLALLDLYRHLLVQKEKETHESIARRKKGLNAVVKTRADVDVMKKNLAQKKEQVVHATADASHKSEREKRQAEAGLERAELLIKGLEGYVQRWNDEITLIEEQRTSLVGTAMLSASFVSFAGQFAPPTRQKLWAGAWKPDLEKRLERLRVPISLSKDAAPLDMLASEGSNMLMVSEGLPSDSASLESGAILSSCKRWPLIIDPQGHAMSWLRSRLSTKVAKSGIGVIVLRPGSWPSKPKMSSPQSRAAGLYLKELSPAVQEHNRKQNDHQRWWPRLKDAIKAGAPVIIDGMAKLTDNGNTFGVRSELWPVVRQQYRWKRTSYVLDLHDGEIEYDRGFRLFLHTKEERARFLPDLQTCTTLIDFTVSESALTEQLVLELVRQKRADLADNKVAAIEDVQRHSERLERLEADILDKLVALDADILADTSLIDGFARAREAVALIGQAQDRGQTATKQFDAVGERYRAVATEGTILYSLLTQLGQRNIVYQFSYDAFMAIFKSASDKVPGKSADPMQHAVALRNSLRIDVFRWASRAMSADDKLVFLASIVFELSVRGLLPNAQVTREHLQFLLHPQQQDAGAGETNPLQEWLPDAAWQSAQALSKLGGFRSFAAGLVRASADVREWNTHAAPEGTPLPEALPFPRTPFGRLLALRCLRQDGFQCEPALHQLIADVLPGGRQYLECDNELSDSAILIETLRNSAPSTPILFILAGDVDVIAGYELRKVSKLPEFGQTDDSFFTVSMGQGADVIAMKLLLQCMSGGGWLLLQNLDLMPKWSADLDAFLDLYFGGTTATQQQEGRFRLFLSMLPPRDWNPLLKRSVKLASRVSRGLKAMMKRSFASLDQAEFDQHSAETKAVLFGLCYFHALMQGRQQFGVLGTRCVFTAADLNDAATSVVRSMQGGIGRARGTGDKIPWATMHHELGDLLYGGSATASLDRLLVRTYLEWCVDAKLLEAGTELCPHIEEADPSSFKACAPESSHGAFLAHIDTIPDGSTTVFGLHPNAEITQHAHQTAALLRAVGSLALGEGGVDPPTGKDAAAASTRVEAAAAAAMEKAKGIIGRFPRGVGEPAAASTMAARDMDAARGQDPESVDGPYHIVLLLECSTMERVVGEIRRSLNEMSQVLRGEVLARAEVTALQRSLLAHHVPYGWARLAWPSCRGLGAWVSDLVRRVKQLVDWARHNEATFCAADHAKPAQPKVAPLPVTWLGGIVAQQAFLAAVRQETALRKRIALDALVTQAAIREATSADAADTDAPARDSNNDSNDSVLVEGLWMQGARWDAEEGGIARARPKELFCAMPVVAVRAVLEADADTDCYQCPVFRTTRRSVAEEHKRKAGQQRLDRVIFPGAVFSVQLKSRSPPSRWVLAGVALVLDITNDITQQ
eukprot:g3391.t1